MTFELLSPLEGLLIALRESRAMHRCPYANGVGTCATGCYTEPHCMTDCPDREGWQPEITRLELLIAHDLVTGAGECWLRYSPGRFYATYHPTAPQGLSRCTVCHRVVVRGQGRWWE